MKIFYSDRIFYRDRMESGYFMVDGNYIAGFSRERPSISKLDFYDYSDKIIAPGLVDTHIHGFLGHDFMDCEKGALEIISRGLLSCGVTSFLATGLSQAKDQIERAIKVIGDEMNGVTGARCLGIFLEGPFFSEEYKGAQNASNMMDPDPYLIKYWQDISSGSIKKVGLAPERKGSIPFMREMKRMGIFVALGHSSASFSETQEALENGASIFIHAFNAMSPFHHREPGMVGAMLLSDAYCEMICDGNHLDKRAVELLIKNVGKDRTLLVSDCMRAGGLDDGTYNLGDFPVQVKGGKALLEGRDVLAGSILKLNDGMKRIYDWGLVSMEEAIRMGTSIPAKSIGMERSVGFLEEGRKADFIVLDGEMNLLETYLGGELSYKKSISPV